MFVCACCGKPVLNIGFEYIKSCGHKDSAIIANLKAVTYGEGSATQKK